jgi:hypothetical protein
MRTLTMILVMLFALPVTMARGHASEDALVGKWTGTYDGGGTPGKYAMTLARDAAKKLTGSLDVMPEGGGGYNVPFKSVEATGQAVVLKYDSPEGNAVVQIDVLIEGTSLTGTWKALDPANNAVVAEGTLTGTRS